MPFRKSKRNRNELITVKDRNPFFYLEHARVEVDGDCLIFHQLNPDARTPEIIPFPIATYQAIFFGPGISITHRALAPAYLPSSLGKTFPSTMIALRSARAAQVIFRSR